GEGWQFYRLGFSSGDGTDLDIRFVAEGPLKAWVDDVVVSRVPAGETWVEKVGSWLHSLWTSLREIARHLDAPGDVTVASGRLQRSLTPGRRAQLEERRPYKHEGPGSIPGPPTRTNAAGQH